MTIDAASVPVRLWTGARHGRAHRARPSVIDGRSHGRADQRAGGGADGVGNVPPRRRLSAIMQLNISRAPGRGRTTG